MFAIVNIGQYVYFFSKKSFIWGKSKWFAVLFQSLSIVLNLANNKNKIYKDFEYWSRNMLNFDFLEKGLGIVSPPHFVHDFSRKTFVKLYSSGWPLFIAWLSLFLKILVNMCIAIVLQLFVNQFCDIIDFKLTMFF